MLSMNLFQLIQRTNYNGVSLNLTRKFAYQLVLVLKQLEEHDPPIIHCDVKPENVVLRDPSRSSIRLIDFGSACCMQQGAKMYKYVQSRFYRSAEVILELGYDTAIDRWSLGCMLVELHTGIPLFAGKNEMDQLARFTGVLGPLPDDMIERSNKKDLFFYDMGQAQQESYVRPLAARGGSPPLLGHGQQQDLAASPSPVIAAEVLNSLSATSSISAVTAASAVTGGTYSTPAPASTAPQPSLPPAPPTVSEARQSHRNFAITPSGSVGVTCPSNHNNNNTVVAVPALRRPMTAVTMEPSSKKGGIGGKVGGGGGGFSSVGSRTASSRPATSIRKSQKAHVNVITPADSPTTTTTTTTTTTIVVPPVVTPSSLASGGLRQSALTPKPRLTTSNHLLVHGDGTPSSSSKISRAGLQHPQQQQQQQQMGALPSKSPFLLRVQPTPDQCQSLEEIIGVYSGGPRGCRRGQPGHDVEDYKVFLDFIQRLLCYDPRKRMSCTEALQHPFLAELEMQKQWKYLSGGAP
ncbi:serine/threonine protein kinase [Trypanosoma grayi]|uniref:serine/threonine protein kinase n=1 Tax=Trypanosoma grayi TaxID=71804 RepID=UPI0004F46B90|nr:serine/threonine protein kinase [Trypanosoma grayi]KEG08314.1 serine/threonine protein kinase [Trypanosoma grayi]